MINILTIDVEEWYHHSLIYSGIKTLSDNNSESRVVKPTIRVLDILDKTDNKATFFVLGEVAEKHPDMVKEIADRGHEVASHGYLHNLVSGYAKEQFETDLKKSIEIIEKIINQKIIGYRAPSWSLNEKTPWAWEILHSLGFKYDSSMYPFKTFLYGNNKNPVCSHDIEINKNATLKEIPPSVAEILNRRIPFSGGLFFRVLPYRYIKWCISKYNKQGNPAVMYIHPWELDMNIPRLNIGIRDRLIIYANIKKTEKKLIRLLNTYKFQSIKDFYAL